MNSNLCWLLVRLAIFLGVLLGPSREQGTYQEFVNRHIEIKGPGSANINSYCTLMMMQRGMTKPRCKPSNIFIHAKPAEVQVICGAGGRPFWGNLRSSHRPFHITVCRNTGTLARGGGCQYSARKEHTKGKKKMALLTSSAFCLLGILICGSFLGAEAATCARGWLRHHGNCYAYFDEQLTWHDAEIECQSYGPRVHLASVLTMAETLLVAKHISTYQKVLSNVWIGLQDVDQTGKWRWADASTYNYRAWNKNEPNNYGGVEHCVELRYSTDFKKWNDISCQYRNAYICKHEL
ncbi:hypothetical protein lerEdw1_015982 [Lerista edwardsae]|nr:hypothetical protein lerEdw1_015982 [Lerista edwardsae]